MKKLLTLVAIIVSLQGCIFVAGAAAGAAAVAVVYDHRKFELVVQDQKINHAVVTKINEIPELSENSHISVSTFNQVVLLTGEAATPELRQQIEATAHAVADVKQIYNEIVVKRPTSSLTRASDSWISAKIKTQMLATKGLQSGTIKVVTEDGTVFLMGLVNRDQADMAVEIARKVSGVQKVVKIFQFTN